MADKDIKRVKKNDTTTKENGIKKLLNFFRIAPSSNGKITPTRPKSTNNTRKKTSDYVPIEMPTSVQQAYQYFVDNLNTGIYRSNQYRMERYKDIKYATTVEPLLNNAVNIYVSEAYAPENGKKPIEIHAKNKKTESLFYEWMNSVGFDDLTIRSCIRNLVVYGDSFWVNNITDNGVESITMLDPFLVANRIEFSVGMVTQMKQWSQTVLNLVNTYGSLKQIYDIVTGDSLEDISQFYKSYLFGYELKLSAETEDGKGVKGVPPWAITHCRMFSTETDFFPFGKPVFLNAIPSFKSYRTTQMLIDMLRVASFPRENITIKGEEGMDIYTRMARVDEVRRFLEKITPSSTQDDLSTVGSRIYSIEGLFDFDVIDPDVDLDKLGDLEYKRTDMIMSTGIPDSYLNPSEGAGDLGGENAESLKYLNRIFQRRADCLRESFLEGLSSTFRMHLMLIGHGNGDSEEFELSMPNSVEDMNADAIDKDSDTFTFAKDILDSLGTMVGLERGDSLPQDVVIDVLKTYLPVHSDRIKKWIKALYDYSEEVEEEKESENNAVSDGETADDGKGTVKEPIIGKGGMLPSKPKHESVKRLDEIIRSDKMNEIYLECRKKRGVTSGNFGNITCYNDSYKTRDAFSPISMLKEQINLNKISRIRESLDIDKGK